MTRVVSKWYTRVMKNRTKIKSCPFCGSKAIVKDFTGDEYYPGWAICCESSTCDVSSGTSIKDTKEEAISIWNTRYTEG